MGNSDYSLSNEDAVRIINTDPIKKNKTKQATLFSNREEEIGRAKRILNKRRRKDETVPINLQQW